LHSLTTETDQIKDMLAHEIQPGSILCLFITA